MFAETQKLELIEVNLEILKLKTVTAEDFQLQSVIDEIQLKAKKWITNKTLLFFYEIQESPDLLKKLRYFYENLPKLAIIAAGSLLEFVLNDENFSFPVGRVEFFHLAFQNLGQLPPQLFYQRKAESRD